VVPPYSSQLRCCWWHPSLASSWAFSLAGKILKWEKGEASIIGWLLQTKALIMIIFANILLDKQIITSETFTALLLMAVASTMLTVPAVTPLLARMACSGRA
jgi:Kef-type K+ transport system membrane component KefB